MTPPTKLTPGAERLLRRLVEAYANGMETEGFAFSVLPKGGQRTILLRWHADGLVNRDPCEGKRSDGGNNLIDGFTITAEGVAWARSLGVEVGPVCPGCHAVGGEKCAPSCIDAEIEAEQREAIESGDYDRGEEEDES